MMDDTVVAVPWIVEVAEDGETYKMVSAGRSRKEAKLTMDELLRWPYSAGRVLYGTKVVGVYKRAWSGKVVSYWVKE